MFFSEWYITMQIRSSFSTSICYLFPFKLLHFQSKITVHKRLYGATMVSLSNCQDLLLVVSENVCSQFSYDLIFTYFHRILFAVTSDMNSFALF